MGLKRIWRFPRGVGGKRAARGCRGEALVVVDACRRVGNGQACPHGAEVSVCRLCVRRAVLVAEAEELR